MAAHVVTAAAVRVVVGTSALIVERGNTLPEDVPAGTVKHLASKGLIATKAADKS